VAVSASYREYVLEQLERVAPIRAKNMFGGVGIYSGDVFFAIVADDVLYFKVNDGNRAAYEARGMEPFRPFADRPGTMSYYELPPDVLEDVEALEVWMQAALAAAGARAGSSG
jgi:DNA transformation protein